MPKAPAGRLKGVTGGVGGPGGPKGGDTESPLGPLIKI